MRTKRQPTIKTMLLLMAVISIQLAALVGHIEPGYSSWNIEFKIGLWCAFASSIAFWSVIPLAIALLIRSARLVGVIGFGLGLTMLFFDLYCSYRLFDLFEFGTAIAVMGLFIGPLETFKPVWNWWQTSYPGPVPALTKTVINLLWLATYTTTFFLIAKSCRLREQTKATSPTP